MTDGAGGVSIRRLRRIFPTDPGRLLPIGEDRLHVVEQMAAAVLPLPAEIRDEGVTGANVDSVRFKEIADGRLNRRRDRG